MMSFIPAEPKGMPRGLHTPGGRFVVRVARGDCAKPSLRLRVAVNLVAETVVQLVTSLPDGTFYELPARSARDRGR